MKYIEIYLFISLILIYLIKSKFQNKNITLKYSTIDHKEYFILNQPDSIKAANQLAIVNKKIRKLFNCCKKSVNRKEGIDRMISKYDFDSLSELNPNSKYSAYSLNKGEKIKLCLRDINMVLINDINSSMFIICHELSHLMTIEEQHPPIFWDNMVFILNKAKECGIYNPIDYSKYPIKYGSNIINNNPLFTTNKKGNKKYPYIN
tara:strand:+ start:1475 stop:2089 length:615 start_codon:yes stop_codon:yes gene_type:complete